MSKLSVEFGAVDSGLDATIKRVNSGLDKLDANAKQASGSFVSGLKGMAIGGAIAGAAMAASMAAINAAVRGVSAVIGGFGDALDLGGELTDLSARTGETAGNLLILQRAFENNGVSADKVGSSINKLQKFMSDASLGAEKNIETIASLGLSMSELAGKTPTEQMKILAERIAAVDDPTRRAGMAMTIFGKSGGELLPVLSNLAGEIDTAKSQLGGMPGVMDRSAAAFDTISDNMTVLKSKLMEVAAGFLESATPALVHFTKMLTGVDAAGWGKKMMETLTNFADFLSGAFRNPLESIKLIGTALLASAKMFGNALMNGVIDLGNTFGVVFAAGFETIVNDFKSLMVQGAGAYLTFMTEGMIKAASILGGDVEKVAKNIGGPLKDSFQIATKIYSGQMDLANRKIEDDLSSTMENTRKSTVDFFGAQPELDRLRDGTQKLQDDGAKFRKEIEASFDTSFDMTKDIKKIPMFGWDMRNQLEKGANSMEKAAAKVKETLTLTQKIMKDIADAEKAQGLDKGGKLQNRIKQEIEEGNFKQARRLVDRLGEQEQEQAIRGDGKDRDRRNLVDIAKAEGIDTFRMSRDQIRDAITKKRQENLKPENKGLNKAEKAAADKPAKADPVDSLTKLVEKIHSLVAKIEPKLPQHALN